MSVVSWTGLAPGSSPDGAVLATGVVLSRVSKCLTRRWVVPWSGRNCSAALAS